jgi:hypothetical protein
MFRAWADSVRRPGDEAMSDTAQHGDDGNRAEDDLLFETYQSMVDAWQKGDLPGFTSEDEFRRYAESRS